MHSLPIGVLFAVVSATRIWTASSLEDVNPDTMPPPGAEPHARIYAARGEYESFQLCIRSSYRTIEHLDIAPEELTDAIGAPEIRRVDYLALEAPSPRAFGEQSVRPDPLSEFQPFALEKDTTGVLWVTYYVPAECPSGLHEGRLGVYLGGRTKRYVNVTLEVFDFEMPAIPSITATMQLDAEPVRSFCGIAGDTLNEWKPFYDALSPWRVAYDSVVAYPDAPQEMAPYLEHLLYAASSARMSAVCVGMGERLANRSSPETLSLIAGAMSNQGLARRAYAEPMPPLSRSHWAEMQDRYARMEEIAPSLRRLVQSAPHPDIQEMAEIWVIPLRFFDPIAIQRLRQGMSLTAEPAYSLEKVRASSSARIPTQDMPYAAAPPDACDGSLYTAWTSAGSPSESAPEWLELRLLKPVSTSMVRVGWRPGYEAADPQVELTQDGTLWVPARINWRHHPSDRRFDPSWSEGVFDREKRFLGIRLAFLHTLSGLPVSVTEIELGQAPAPSTIQYLSGGAEVWFDQRTTPFPSFYADAHPVEARLGPWVCWGHELDGMFGQPLNQWPEAWKQLDAPAPHVWPAAGNGERFLVYPGRGTLAPSIRLHRMRDGLEDFEYLRAAMEKGVDDQLIGPDTMRVCRWEYFKDGIEPDRLDDVRNEIQKLRTAIGRGVTKAAKEN